MSRLSWTNRLLLSSTCAALGLLIALSPAFAATGPYLVKNIKAGSGSSQPGEFTELNGFVVFTAAGGGAGYELWRSDGTKSGTFRLRDIRPGSKTSNPRELARIGNKVFFSANDGVHGQELWITDGTIAGTQMVKDIAPGKGHAFYRGDWPGALFVDVQGAAFFVNSADNKLWRSDGTAAGTYAVPGSPNYASGLTPLADRVYFNADGNLWRSNGTEVGTRKVKNSAGNFLPDANEIAAAGSLVYFEYNESRVWRTDGTAPGTFKVLDLGAGCSGYGCLPMMLTAAGSLIYFSPVGWNAIWRSDGTAADTFQVMPLGGASSDMFVPVGDRMYLKPHSLYVSDGTVEGTVPVDLPDGLSVAHVFDVAGAAYYGAWTPEDGTPGRLYSTDGTAAGTHPMGPATMTGPYGLTVAGNHVFFAAWDSRGRELWAFIP